MRRIGGLGVLLALLAGASAGAQEAGDKARLDEFAVPAAEAGPPLEQLGSGADALPSSAPAVDRSLAIPGLGGQSDHAPVAQLSPTGERSEAPQLSEADESRDLADRSVSSERDSRPQPAAALAGQDRCDPQLGDEGLERCRAILELRAAEFDAPEAPRLTAEQVLLAEQGQIGPSLSGGSSRAGVRLAQDDPDADLLSNQALASVYIDRAAGERPADPRADALPDGVDPSVIEALQGLQIDLGATGAR